MARDISAFANADGGQIVYGMTEKDHEPAGLDAGLDPKEYPEIWFEQVLQQHVTPLLEGVRPRHVKLKSGRVAVVVDVPASKSDPHQADGRYYRRHNFNRLAMEHYEVRDMFRRTTTPELKVSLSFEHGRKTQIEFPHQSELSNAIILNVTIENVSVQPAFHVFTEVWVDEGLNPAFALPKFTHVRLDPGPPKLRVYRNVLTSPPDPPIFREGDAAKHLGQIAFNVPARFLSGETLFDLKTIVQTPGFAKTEHWAMRTRAGWIEIHGPGGPWTAHIRS